MQNKSFEAANQTVHPVEKQWHYPILTKYGYVAETKEGVGFVRSYRYVHPETNRVIVCTTGASADYWRDPADANQGGYWMSLEPYLVKLTEQ